MKNILSKNETQENLVENVICFSCGDIFTENLIALLKEKNINVFRITFGETTNRPIDTITLSEIPKSVLIHYSMNLRK